MQLATVHYDIFARNAISSSYPLPHFLQPQATT